MKFWRRRKTFRAPRAASFRGNGLWAQWIARMGQHHPRNKSVVYRRARIITIVSFMAAAGMIARLFWVQIVQHRFYKALALGQHEMYRQLFPSRGDILVRDRDGTLFPVATTRELALVWADLRKVENSTRAAKVLAEILEMDEWELKAKLEPRDDPFEFIAKEVSDEKAARIREANLPGIGLRPELKRMYPERGFGGQLLGFLGSNEAGDFSGRYGLEGYYETELKGTQGFLSAKRDPAGRLIAVANRSGKPAEDGVDLVLTIDRSIQYFACERLRLAILQFAADGGSVVVLDPKTGAVISMCGAPDFDPNEYQSVPDISVFNNPALFAAYEPGSVMKAITMAAAIDAGAISPQTTYTDEGSVTIGPHTIKNSDGKAHGLQTMTQVLEESLNTGVVFAMREVGAKTLRSSIERFGFGARTDVDLLKEADGNIASLEQRGEIYAATASFGQGITVTPIQLAAAFGAIANQGKLMKPFVVAEMRKADGSVTATMPELRRQTISVRTAHLLDAMLVSVVERGHGKRAGVPGYYIAGKTGTAQVPKKDGLGYEDGVTIGTFTGFGPVEDPRFVMSVRIDHPRNVQFAESSAAPLFGEIAKFLLQYYQIPPTRSVE